MAQQTCEPPFVMWDKSCVLPVEEYFDLFWQAIIVLLLITLVVAGIFNVLARISVVNNVIAAMSNKVTDIGQAVTSGDYDQLHQIIHNAEKHGRKESTAEQDAAREKREESKNAIAFGKEYWLRVSAGVGSHLKRVHKDFIVGIGLPLFYNDHILPAGSAVLGILVLPRMHEAPDEDLGSHASSMFQSLAILYVVLMISSMVHVRMQRYFAVWFRMQNTVLHDYSIELAHVPPWMTNEKNMLRSLHEEGLMGRFVGVSIAYDYREYADEISQMWEHVVVMLDAEDKYQKEMVRLAKSEEAAKGDREASKLLWEERKLIEQKYEIKKKETKEISEKDKKRFKEILPKLECSGTVFVVMQSLTECKKLLKTYNGFWIKDHIKCKEKDELPQLQESIARNMIQQTAPLAAPWRMLGADLKIGNLTLPEGAFIRDSHVEGMILEYKTDEAEVHTVQLDDEEVSHSELKKVLDEDNTGSGGWLSSGGGKSWTRLPKSVAFTSEFLPKGRYARFHHGSRIVEYQGLAPHSGHLEKSPDTEDLKNRVDQVCVRQEQTWKTLKATISTPSKGKIDEGSRIREELGDEGVDFACERYVSIVRHSTQEPPGMIWENFGNTRASTRVKMQKGVFFTFLTFVLIFLLVMKPYRSYIQVPYQNLNQSPKGITTQLFGAIVGIFNNILGAVMWQNLWAAGFTSWMDLDIHAYIFNVCVGTFNNAFNTAQSIKFTPTLWTLADEPEVIKANIQNEIAFNDEFLEMLIPGWFFSGFFIGQAVGIVVPFVQNLILLNIIFVWQWFPTWVNKLLQAIVNSNPDPEQPLTKRKAELVFTPGTIGLCWDLGNIILIPSITFATLLFASERPRRIFWWLLAYTIMIYWWHRLVTLKLKKKEMTASAKLARTNWRVWGLLPLSVLALALGLWGHRLGYWNEYCIPLWLAFHVVLYLFLLDQNMPRLEQETIVDSTYWEVQHKLKYSWFNSNPVHVLKSRYVPDQIPTLSRAAVPFVYGKEYLLKGEDHVMSTVPNKKEFTWRKFAFWWCPNDICKTGVQDQLTEPLVSKSPC